MHFEYGSKVKLIEADPLGGTIGGMYKNTLYALNSSPFMSAVFRKDGRVLGNYLRKKDNILQKLTVTQGHSSRQIFVQKMQEAGAVRQDIDGLSYCSGCNRSADSDDNILFHRRV